MASGRAKFVSTFRSMTVFAVVLAYVFVGTAEAADHTSIDRLAKRTLQEWHQPGLALAIVENGVATHVRGYGVRDLRTGAAVTPDTVFGIASCSKAFGAATVAKLVDTHRLNWNDRVDTYLPWFRSNDPQVTHDLRIKDLLAHRSGLHAAIPRNAARDRMSYLRSIAVAEPLHPFRYQFSYTNDMFTLAGQLVAEVTGTAWEDFARKELWEPLGMAHTNADHRAARVMADSAVPHVMIGGKLTPVPWIYEDRTALPSGGINSTATDLSQWIRFQVSGGTIDGRTLISRATFDEMHSSQTPMTAEASHASMDTFASIVGTGPQGIQSRSYGLGWFVHYYRGYKVVSHPGSIAGFRCFIGLLPERGFGVAVLSNAEQSMLGPSILQTLIDEQIGVKPKDWSSLFRARQNELLEKERASLVALDAARVRDAPPTRPLREYAGTYAREGIAETIEVALLEEKIAFTLGRMEYEAVPWNYDVFRLIPRRIDTDDGKVDWPYDIDDSRALVTFHLDEHARLSEVETAFGVFRRVETAAKQ
jgi:CubicO group peptidase (beta-lactamase class C family)